MTLPTRIQRKRTKGWRMPQGAVYVGRGTRWGNPFVPGQPHRLTGGSPVKNREQAYDLYDLHTGPMGSYELDIEEARRLLGGKPLACWCPLPEPGQPDLCHAAVLIEVANSEPPERTSS